MTPDPTRHLQRLRQSYYPLASKRPDERLPWLRFRLAYALDQRGDAARAMQEYRRSFNGAGACVGAQ